jgi:hypothetical protein
MAKSTRTTTAAGHTVVTLRLPPERLEALRARAEAEQRSLSGQIRYVLDRWIEQEDAAA